MTPTGNTLWVWQVQDRTGWGIIAAIVPAVLSSPAPLVTRSEEVARTMFQVAAEHHGKATGLKIRLAKFELTEFTYV